jgi:hypothetical protein
MFIALVVRRQLYPIWPLVLTLNLASILILLSRLSSANLAYTDFSCSMYQTSLHCPEISSCVQRIHPISRLFQSFCKRKDDGPLHFRCSRLLIQYIPSFLPYLKAVSSFHNLSTCHTVGTRGLTNIAREQIIFVNWGIQVKSKAVP